MSKLTALATRLGHGITGFLSSCLREVFNRRTLALMAAFSPVSITFLLTVPPLWCGYDGMIQIAGEPGELTIIQYPIAYPLFSRTFIYATEIVGALAKGSWPHIDITQNVVLSDAGIYTLLAFQHLLLLLALAFLVRACTSSRLMAGVLVVLFASNAAFFVAAQMVSSEALSVSLTILLIATGLKIASQEAPPGRYYAAFAVSLYVELMTRHVNSVFAGLLPLASLLGIVTRWRGNGDARASFVRMLMISAALGLGCMLMATWTTKLLCRAFGLDYRSIVGRAAVERIDFVNRLPDDERNALLARLQAKANDPITKQALGILWEGRHHWGWVEAFQKLGPLILERHPGMKRKSLRLMEDRYLNELCKLYFLSFHPQLVGEMKQSIWLGFTTSPTTLSRQLVKQAAWSIDVYNNEGYFHESVAGLASCGPDAKKKIVALERSAYLRVWDRAPGLALFGIGTVGAGILWFSRTGDRRRLLFAVATAVTGLLIVAMTFFLIPYVPRYTLPMCISAFAMVGTVAGAFRRRPRDDANARRDS
jgi:hypothetical protein